MQIDDDPTFDPRLHWAEANNEYVSSIVLMERAKYDLYMKALQFMESQPTTIVQIADHLKVPVDRARTLIQCLRGRGVIFHSERDKKTRVITYTVKSRPLRILFNPPSYYVKVKVRQK